MKTFLDNLKFAGFVSCHFEKKKKEVTIKIKDHCHITGIYQGVAQTYCDKNVTQNSLAFILIALHHMTNFDSNLFIKEFCNRKDPKVNLEVIPQTDERFSSITYGRIRSIDSMNFMKMSLGTIVKAKGLGDFVKKIWSWMVVVY